MLLQVVKPLQIINHFSSGLTKLSNFRLTICYDGLLSEGVALKEFQLDHYQNEVTEKCLKIFHGFQVSLLRGKYNASEFKMHLFFRVHTTFTREP